MRPPPIRYPLPSLILLLLLSLLVWKGEGWTREWRAELGGRLDRVVHGPPVPASKEPKAVTGVIARRGLTLREDVPVYDTPNGTVLAPIARRGFVSIYDEWSSRGEDATPEFYRVGTRVAIGWIGAADLLPWDTRLVLRGHPGRLELADSPGGTARSVEVDGTPMPVIGWRDRSVRVVTWSATGAWSEPSGRGWIEVEKLPQADLGILVAQVELPALLRAAIAVRDPGDASRVRLKAVLGRVLDEPGWTETQIGEALAFLPDWVVPKSTVVAPTDRLAEINAGSDQDGVKIGNSTFRFVGLDALP